MRNLVLLRGSAGVGKSTFVALNNVERFTISSDNIRLLFQSPILEVNGQEVVSGKNDKRVWSFLYQLVEDKMKRGEFILVDATHTTENSINRYKEMAIKYRYRVWVVDFTNIPIEEAKKRNAQRVEYKKVPNEVIDKMYERFNSSRVPSWVKVIKPEEFKKTFKFKALDFSEYEKIHIIGDIHACYTALATYLVGGLNDKHLYIFCGDYIDRGIENAEVMSFLMSIMNKGNVILLEGNHEIHLWKWANDEQAVSEEFEQRTVPQLVAGGIDKKDVRVFYRSLRQLAYFKYHDKKIIVTHGGLSTLPANLNYVATEQIIKGVGVYKTPIDDIFKSTTKDDIFQVHGHRNVQGFPIFVNNRSFNLEGSVECGGDLRIVTFERGVISAINVPNEVYNKERFKKKQDIIPIEVDNKEFLNNLRASEFIVEKQLEDNISSFNFSRKVFYDRLWTSQPETLKARGLFVNTKTTEIVGRSYNKFFNVGEMEFTQLENLEKTLVFPVRSYIKENGYLGIVGYNSETDKLLIASKSTTQSDFAKWFEKMFYKVVNTDAKERAIKDRLRDIGCSLVFEVIDMENDSHIISYSENRLVLLDIVYRTPNYTKMCYAGVKAFAQDFGFETKKLYKVLNNWDEFMGWYKDVSKEDFTIEGQAIEGFVVEDSIGFMTKIKLPYYNFWKYMRIIKDKIIKGTNINKSDLSDEALKFITWLEGQAKDVLQGKDIITLRKTYYEKT